MLNGADVRKYRQTLGMDQRSFARLLNLSQAALSLIELGKTPVSEKHLSKMRLAFSDEPASPTFQDYLDHLEQQRLSGQAMLGYPPGSHATLTIWRWTDGVDLSSSPSTGEAVGSVTLRANPDDAIAFQMMTKTPYWSENEILVFIRTRPDDCEDQDLCLIQLKRPHTPHPTTGIAVVHIAEGKRNRAFQLQLLDSRTPIFSPSANELLAVLRCTYRAKYV